MSNTKFFAVAIFHKRKGELKLVEVEAEDNIKAIEEAFKTIDHSDYSYEKHIYSKTYLVNTLWI